MEYYSFKVTLIILVSHVSVWGESDLAEDRRVGVSQGVAEVLGCQQARGQAVHAQTFRVQQWVCEGAHLSPVDIQHAGAQLLSQQLRLGPGSRVLLHVLYEAVALGMPRGGAVHQKTALQVTEGAHKLLKLLLGESTGQVGDAQQSICWLQLHRDLPVPQHMLVEVFDGTLRLFPIQQRHKC